MAYTFLENDTHCLLIAERTMVWRKPASGDKFAPYKNPVAHLDLVEFCSDWDYYAVRSRQSVALTHQAVAGVVIYDDRGFGGQQPVSVGQTAVQDQVLVTHNAGYVPRFRVAQDNRVLPQGMPVQNTAAGTRWVSFYATTSQIICRNVGVSTDLTLPAISVSYDVAVFKDVDEVPVGPALPMFWADNARAIMGRGRFDTNTTTMRLGSVAESPFWIPRGRNVDFAQGRVRVVLPNGPTFSQPGYDGSFAGSAFQRAFI